jgi:hypothetical protein
LLVEWRIFLGTMATKLQRAGHCKKVKKSYAQTKLKLREYTFDIAYVDIFCYILDQKIKFEFLKIYATYFGTKEVV